MNNQGQPTIRDLNLNVSDVFRLLGSGQTELQIIENHPGLEREDFLAVYEFAASADWRQLEFPIDDN